MVPHRNENAVLAVPEGGPRRGRLQAASPSGTFATHQHWPFVKMASPAEVEKGMKMAEQEMEYRVDLFNRYIPAFERKPLS